MTKRSEIVALAQQGLTVREIAVAVYGLSSDLPSREIDRKAAYVRVVLRQRNRGGVSKYDQAYRISEAARTYHRNWMRAWQRRRYHDDPNFKEMRLAAARAYKARLARERSMKASTDETP